MKKAFGCYGFRIPLPGRWQVEFWFCPKGAEIPVHVHMRVHSWICMLFGKMLWSVKGQEREVCCPIRVRKSGGLGLSAYHVGARVPHGAKVTGPFGLFMNVERWIGQKVSAADDLVF